MYKSDKTTYVIRDIPVELWKQVKSKFLFQKAGHKSIGGVIIFLLEKWIKESQDDENKQT